MSRVLADAVTGAGRVERVQRLSLTVPSGVEVRPSAEELVRRMAEDETSLLLVDRRRTNGTEHLYGLAQVRRAPREVISTWCEISGGYPEAQKANGVRGWGRYARTGDDRELREELRTVVAYALKPWPLEYGVRGPGDFYSCGLLGQVWRVFCAEEASGAIAATNGPRTVNACRWCRRPMPSSKRADATTCSASCRVSLCRSLKRSEMTQAPLFVETTSARGTKAAQSRSRGGAE